VGGRERERVTGVVIMLVRDQDSPQRSRLDAELAEPALELGGREPAVDEQPRSR